MHVDMNLGVLKRFPRKPNVARAIFNQKNFHRGGALSDRLRHLPSVSGRAKWKVEPSPGCDSTQILPPSRSRIFLQIANPIPVPLNSVCPCNRWKRMKILSKY